MILGKVVGTVVSTIKHPVYEGKTVLMVQPIDAAGKSMGNVFLSLDTVQAGVGDTVLASREGNTARQLLGTDKDPFHSVILAIVDDIRLRPGDRSGSQAAV